MLLVMVSLAASSTLFPYTTLFRSILFVDELHNLIGQGTAMGAAMDAANMLKPALVRGDIRVIGATTGRSEEHTSELQSLTNLVCRLLLEKKKPKRPKQI